MDLFFPGGDDLERTKTGKRTVGANPIPLRFLTDAEAVQLLVERIRHPHLSLDDLSQALHTKGMAISSESIRRFLGQHGLLKKTTDTLSFDT